jgi:hypothetical protein
MVLKMMNNLRDESGRGLALSSTMRMGSEHGNEYEIPMQLPAHPGVIHVLHHFQGSTDNYRLYVNMIISGGMGVSMARRTTFVVLPRYCKSLRRFLDDRRAGKRDDDVSLKSGCVYGSREGSGDELEYSGVRESEWRLLLIELLDIVVFLGSQYVAHRDIKVC